MSIAEISVGIDYHQSSLQVAVMNEKGVVLGNRSVSNDVGEVIKFVSNHGELASVAVEACTGSANFADELKRRSGWEVKLCHPGYVQRMRHNPDKTDKSDGYLLSDLNRVGYLPEVWLAPERLRDLKELVRYRKQLVEQRKETKQRIRAILRHHRVKKPEEVNCWWTKICLNWLERIDSLPEHTQWTFGNHLKEHERLTERVKEVEQRLDKATSDDVIVNHLASLKGVGLVTAATIRAEVGQFSRFKKGKQLSRFCGVTPRNCSSGERQADAGLIKAGNPSLKTVIIEVCHSLVRHDSKWNKFARRLKQKGKPYCVIIGAVANRWIRQLHFEMVQVEQSA